MPSQKINMFALFCFHLILYVYIKLPSQTWSLSLGNVTVVE